jgi:hypothetical protein
LHRQELQIFLGAQNHDQLSFFRERPFVSRRELSALFLKMSAQVFFRFFFNIHANTYFILILLVYWGCKVIGCYGPFDLKSIPHLRKIPFKIEDTIIRTQQVDSPEKSESFYTLKL